MRIVHLAMAGAAAACVLAGCGPAGTQATGSASPRNPASATPEAPPERQLADDALLPAGDMPGWNGAVVWEAEAGPGTGAALALCPVPTAAAVGAAHEVSRDYVWSAGDMHARNVVWQFESPASAAAATGQVEDLLRECTNDTSITVADRTSTWTTSAPIDPVASDDTRFEFLGVGEVGTYVTVVGFSLIGQDANWQSDPILDSLLASLERLRERP